LRGLPPAVLSFATRGYSSLRAFKGLVARTSSRRRFWASVLARGPLIFPLSCDELQRIQKMKMAIMIAMSSGLPSWLVVPAAVITPIVMALTFLMVMDWINRPVSVEECNSDPNAGFHVAQRNDALVFLHALAQLAFVAAGAWRIRQRPGVRVAFLLVAIPVSALVFLLSFMVLIAR